MAKSKKIQLTDAEFIFLNSIETVHRSFDYYLDQLKTEFCQLIALRDGDFKANEQFEVSIDLKSEEHILKVTRVDK